MKTNKTSKANHGNKPIAADEHKSGEYIPRSVMIDYIKNNADRASYITLFMAFRLLETTDHE